MRDGPRAVGMALMTALAASQAALVVLNPLLPDVARDLGVSVATAGQVRTASGLAAGLAALTSGLWATRLGLRGLLFVGVGTIAVGSLVSALAPYADGTDLVWAQEEPWNMGAWFFVRARLPEIFGHRFTLRCIARPESASPATGSNAAHKLEQRMLVDEVFRD